MNAPCRVLRFRPAGSATCAVPHARSLIDVYLNDGKTPVGHIVLLDSQAVAPARWTYILSDGRVTGLQSTYSRQDLEADVREYYFEAPAADRLRSA